MKESLNFKFSFSTKDIISVRSLKFKKIHSYKHYQNKGNLCH